MEAEEIKGLRKRLKLTQKQLAARVKVDPITIARWERGMKRPSNHAKRQLTRLQKRGEMLG